MTLQFPLVLGKTSSSLRCLYIWVFLPDTGDYRICDSRLTHLVFSGSVLCSTTLMWSFHSNDPSRLLSRKVYLLVGGFFIHSYSTLVIGTLRTTVLLSPVTHWYLPCRSSSSSISTFHFDPRPLPSGPYCLVNKIR